MVLMAELENSVPGNLPFGLIVQVLIIWLLLTRGGGMGGTPSQ